MTLAQINALAKANAKAQDDLKRKHTAQALWFIIGLVAVIAALAKIGVF